MKFWPAFASTLFYAPADAAGGGGGGEEPDADFAVESASVAFTPAPGDTTAGLDVAAEGDVDGDEAVAVADTGEVSASTAGLNDQGDATGDTREKAEGQQPTHNKPAASPDKGKQTAATTAAGGKKPNKPLTQRVTELKREVDTLTHTKHTTAAETDRARRELTAARRELEDVQRQVRDAKAGQGAADVKPAAAATSATGKDGKAKIEPGAEPEHPKYRDFDTDEAYEEAAGKWRTDHAAWQQRRMDAMRQELSEGIESRFTTEEQRAQQTAAVARLGQTVDAVRTSKADWNEKAAALKDLTSAWYDPKTCGEERTPFLNDLTRSRLMAGDKAGGEILYWLGADLDRAQRLADLLPTRPLRDALVHTPSASIIPLLEHFATDDGAEEFEALKRMHPVAMMQAIGALHTRLQPAPSGPGAVVHPVTKARPSARPQAGSPDARTDTGGSGAAPGQSFDDWMAAEDERERKERLRDAGVAV